MSDTSAAKREFTDLRINPTVASAPAPAKVLRIVANEVWKPELPLAAATFSRFRPGELAAEGGFVVSGGRSRLAPVRFLIIPESLNGLVRPTPPPW